jgi:tRNA(Ile)-lysidine synthetase-like protein
MPAAAMQPEQTPRITRRHEVVARILREYRLRTGGRGVRDADRRCVVACSGGADSSALAIALATMTPRPVVAHIVHDLRPEAEALADRDGTRALAKRLGCAYREEMVRVRALPGNAEANARRVREAALARIAQDERVRFVATGHQADDALETLLMRLARGAGPEGLGGVRATRRLSAGLTLVRPMLVVTRADAQRLCADAGWSWREDATNADLSRLRAAIRAEVVPALERVAPGAGRRVARSAGLFDDAARVLEDRAAAVPTTADGQGVAADRAALRAEPAAVVGVWLRLHTGRVAGAGADRRGSMAAVVRAVRGDGAEPRVFLLRGAQVRVTARQVRVGPREDA